MPKLLDHATLLTPFEEIKDGAVLISDEGLIISIGKTADYHNHSAEHIDVKGKYVTPGFIDMHVHSGFGISFGAGELGSELEKYQSMVTTFGETGFLITITGPDANSIEDIISSYSKVLEKEKSGAQPLGIHLEGPFLCPQKHGAFNLNWIHNPYMNEIQRYLEAGKDWIKQVTLAPDVPLANKAAQLLTDAGVVVALGHSNADYDSAAAALSGLFSHVTHAFNAQSPFNHREPGVVGALLASDLPTAELIADGIHIHAAAMKVLVRCLGIERIAVITDAMPGAGMPDGEYKFVQHKVNVKDRKAKLADGTIGGSTATIDQCVRNMIELVDVPLKDAIRMASYNPAKIINLEKTMGSIEPGKLANLAVIDEKINIEMTFVKGKLAYSRNNEEEIYDEQ